VDGLNQPPVSPFWSSHRSLDDPKKRSLAILSEKEVETRKTILTWLGAIVFFLLVFLGGSYLFLNQQNLSLARISQGQNDNFDDLSGVYEEIVSTLEELSWQKNYSSGIKQDERVSGYYQLNGLFKKGFTLAWRMVSDNNLFSREIGVFTSALLYSDELDYLIDNTNYHGQELISVFGYLLEINDIFLEANKIVLSINDLPKETSPDLYQKKITALGELRQDYDRIYLAYPLPDDLNRLHDKNKLLLEEIFVLAQNLSQENLVSSLDGINYLVFFEALSFWQTSKTIHWSSRLAREWQKTLEKVNNKLLLFST